MNNPNEPNPNHVSDLACFMMENRSDDIVPWHVVICIDEKRSKYRFDIGVGKHDGAINIAKELKRKHKICNQ